MKLEEEVRLGDYLERKSKSINQIKDSNYLDQDQLFHSLHPYERRYLTLIGQVEFKAGEEKEIASMSFMMKFKKKL